jgi:hypothetical protein
MTNLLYGPKFNNCDLKYNLTLEHFIKESPLYVTTDEGPITLSTLDISLEDVKEMEHIVPLDISNSIMINSERLYYLWHYIGFKDGIFASKTLEALNYLLNSDYNYDKEDIKMFCSVENTEVYLLQENLAAFITCLKKRYYNVLYYLIDTINSTTIELPQFWLDLIYEYMLNPTFDKSELLVEWILKRYLDSVFTNCIVEYKNLQKYYFYIYTKLYFVKLLYFYSFYNKHISDSAYHDHMFELLHRKNNKFYISKLSLDLLNDEKTYKMYLSITSSLYYNRVKSLVNWLVEQELPDEKREYIYREVILKLIRQNDTNIIGILESLTSSKVECVKFYINKIISDFLEQITSIVEEDDLSSNLMIYLHKCNVININAVLNLYIKNRQLLSILIYSVQNGADLSLIDCTEKIEELNITIGEFIEKFK